MADLTPAEAQAQANSAAAAAKSYKDISTQQGLIYATLVKMGVSQTKLKASRDEIYKTTLRELTAERAIVESLKSKLGNHTKLSKLAQKNLDNLVSSTVELKKQEGIYSQLTKLSDINVARQRQTIENLKIEGGLRSKIKALVKETFQNKEGVATIPSVAGGVGKMAGGTVGIASHPESVINALGPWGELVKLIVDVIDNLRSMRGQLSAASAAGGDFGRTYAKANAEATMLKSSQAELMLAYGQTTDEATKQISEMKRAALTGFGDMSRGLTSDYKDIYTFAAATDQSTQEVISQYASMRRISGITQRETQATYKKIFDSANDAAVKGMASVSDWMKGVFGLSDSFKDVGFNLLGIDKLMRNVAGGIKSLGQAGGIDRITAIASGLMNISKAAEGWQVFMAKMAGAQGGYASALFSAQQRTAGGMLPEQGKFDINKSFDMLRSALLNPTKGIADPQMRQLMIEKIGTQYGLDARMVQVFQKMQSGQIGEGAARVSMKQMFDQARSTQIDQKGMFEIIRNILVGLIAKPIIGMYGLMQKMFLTNDEEKQNLADVRAGLSRATEKSGATTVADYNANAPRSALGSDVMKSGIMMVHAGNQIVPVAQRRAYGSSANGGDSNSNINFSINLTVDPKNLHKKFVEMEREVISLLNKQQRANFS